MFNFKEKAMKRDIKDYCCVVTQEQANEAKKLLQKYGETINGRADMFTIDRFGNQYFNILQYYDQNWRTGSDIGLHDKVIASYPQWKQILINQYEYTGMEIQFDTARGADSGVEIEFDTANIEKPEEQNNDFSVLAEQVKSLREMYLELYKRVYNLPHTPEEKMLLPINPYQAGQGKQGDGMVSKLKEGNPFNHLPDSTRIVPIPIDPTEETPKHKVGKWYKGLGSSFFRCTDASNQYKLIGYGWNSNNVWVVKNLGYWIPPFREATHEEVEQRFKEEAKKRGYYDKPFVCLFHKEVIEGACLETLSIDQERFWLQNGCVFDNGKWAEFVKEPKYEIGEVYAFADKEECFDSKNRKFFISELEFMDKSLLYPYKAQGIFYKHIRKIEYKFID
jgi:hypothetical protein